MTLRPIREARSIAAACWTVIISGVLGLASQAGNSAEPYSEAAHLTRTIERQVVGWRRNLHEHPELSNREFRTSKLVAEHLRKLGLEVHTGIAHTGVVAWLKGGHSGPTVALRADMDALPVTERTDVPFKSHAIATYGGETVGVMHACGHDAHTAILMGLAEILTTLRASLHGNVLFIFQPAEEGVSPGEEGGAQLMLKEGLFERYDPDVIFGLHVMSMLSTGTIGYRSGPFLAAVDSFKIVVNGKQAHGARPWQSIDPIVAGAQIINAIQTVVSRQVDITLNPAVVTVGAIKGGIRFNIVPDRVEMLGTLRTFEAEQRQDIVQRATRIVENTAAANGATATFELGETSYPATYNDPTLTAQALPSLRRVVGDDYVKEIARNTGAEDFAFYGQKVPAFFFFVGVTPAGADPMSAPSNHSDYFYLDEQGMLVGLRAMTQLAIDSLMPPKRDDN